MPKLKDYMPHMSPEKGKMRNIGNGTQETLALSRNSWVLVNLVHIDELSPVVQGMLVSRFKDLNSIEAVDKRKPVKHRLNVKNYFVVMGELAAHPRLDESLHYDIVNTSIRLDKEASECIEGNRSSLFMAEDILRSVRSDMRAIALNMIRNNAVSDVRLRKMLSEHFDIPLPEDSIWGKQEECSLYLKRDMNASIWGRAKAVDVPA
ncbi:MAG: hypothetical protein ACREBH_00445 [Candidatus Micrarchaeaceae archaeon]